MKKEINLTLCHEIEIHYKRPVFDTTRKIKSSQDTEKILREFMNTNSLDYKESFVVILLTNANQLLGISNIAIGTQKSVHVSIKEIFQLGLGMHASAIIIAHNHPSGTLKPSKADQELTRKIKEASTLLEFDFLDHIIITSEGYFSFADECLL